MPPTAPSEAASVPAVVEPAALPIVSVEVQTREFEAAATFAVAALAPATRRAYRDDWKRFKEWCDRRGLVALPAEPEVVAAFLAAGANAGLKPATVARRSAAIRYAHGLDRKEPPTSTMQVRATVAGIRRRQGVAPKRKTPATADRIAAMVALAPTGTLRGLRDRALILLGFAGAFRRSELVALRVEDLEETPDGLRVPIRRSKGDQEGAGQDIAIPHGARLRPLAAMREWLDAAGIESGPVFRRVRKNGRVGDEPLNAESVVEIIKSYAARAGLRPEDFAGHSLRSGFLTSAAEAGASALRMAEVSRHKSLDTLLGYVRRADQFRDHAGSSFL
ncbi:MAG: tyrosine-type recombinase/integrase [Acetobacteraceae bacterium]|nr:tyrosine-type recombinase/integrase [Acetobacteraceae bacterium]